MKKLLLPLIILIIQISSADAYSQFKGWNRLYNQSGNTDEATVITESMRGFKEVIIASGKSHNGANIDAVSEIYSAWSGTAYGNILFDRGGDDIVYDAVGKIYRDYFFVTGSSDSAGAGTDVMTLKCSAQGNIIWARFYNGSGNGDDAGKSVEIDDRGSVYVTGYSDEGAGTEYMTIKYDSAGNMKWKKNYSFAPGGLNKGCALTQYNKSLFVTGKSEDSSGFYDYATIKYDTAGNELWSRRYEGQPGSDAEPIGIEVNSIGQSFVTGYSDSAGGSDIVTIKYDSSGQDIWQRRYNGSGNGSDYPVGMDIDIFGNIFIGGNVSDTASGLNFVLLKYNDMGSLEWADTYNGTGNGIDSASAICIDLNQCIFITGKSQGMSTGTDYLTILYNTAGWKHWTNRFRFPNSTGDNIPSSIVCNFVGAFITGKSFISTTNSFDYATLSFQNIIDNITLLSNNLPGEYKMAQNYPNPFNPVTKIRFDISRQENTKILIYNSLGQQVESLLDRTLSPGSYEVTWDALGHTSGIYFYRMISEGKIVDTKKMLLIK